MRKLTFSALMIGCLMLSGCGSTKEKRLETAVQRLTEAQVLSMTAQVQADFGDTVENYTLEYSWDGEQWTALVTEPPLAAGIIARISEDASELEYDGAILSTGDLTGSGISPIGSVPMVMEALRTGMVDSVWEEDTMLASLFVYDDAVSVTVWFDQQNDPVAAELAENGIVKAVCALQIKGAGNGTEDNANLGGDPSGESGT